MANPDDSIIQECPDCGALIDVTPEEPFALMHCPTCGGALRVRRRFDQFELEEALGVGGMGAVYRALDTNLSRPVALKLLQKEHSENPEFVAQFQKEAAITASINHPNVVKVYSTGRDHGRVYIAMELINRGSLDDRMNEEGRVSELQILNVGIQIAQGLNAALQRGLIHRDIKPGNILFSSATNSKIVDFGLAVLMEHAGKVAGEVWGTPYYVAPEPLDDRPEDFRSDMYSLGATLFHALTGNPPHEAETNSMRELLEIKRKPPAPQSIPPDVSSATAHLLHKMLKFAPEERFQSYPELIQHIEYARTEHLTALAKENQRSEVVGSQAPKRSWEWLSYVTAAIVVSAGVGAFEVAQHRVQKPDPGEVAEVPRAALPIDRQYRDACKLLADGDAAHAAVAFLELGKNPGISQPLLDWVFLHGGLAELLAGHDDKAAAQFKEIEDRGVYSTDAAEEKLANFFVDTARLAASENPVPVTAVQTVDGSTYEALALLIFGIKDWNAGRIADAGAFFRQFVSSEPQERHAWVAEYKPIARPYIDDLKALRLAKEASDGAATLGAKKDALQVIRQGRGSLKFPKKTEKEFAAMDEKLQTAITAEETQEAQRIAEQDAADDKILTDAKAKIAPLEQLYKFSEAASIAATIQAAGAKGKAERDALVRNTDWLAKFKHTLVLDIKTIGYPTPMVKRNGTQLPGGARRATEEQVEVVTPFGTLSTPWSDLSPDSLFAIGQYFLKANFPPSSLADRQWYLGVFAMHAGKSKEGRELLMQASQGKEEYKDQLGLFVGAGEGK